MFSPAIRYIFLVCHAEPVEAQTKKDTASTCLSADRSGLARTFVFIKE